MKKLTIVRHAKSSWEFDVGDRDRPLKKRGINDTTLVSSYFDSKKLAVDFVYSSPANRALTTCNLFMEKLRLNKNKLQIDELIYDFGGTNLTRFIQSVSNEYKHIMVFGHNHAITAFVNRFGTEYFDNVPTCGLVSIEFDVEKWEDIESGKTVDYMFPKMLK